MYYSDPVIFEVPTLPRTKKFISVNLRDEQGRPQPLLVSPEALGPGLMLWAMAQAEKVHTYQNYKPRPGHHQRAPALRHYEPEGFTEKIGLGIYEFHPSRRQYLFNHIELVVFTEMVDHMIRNELVTICEAQPDTAPMLHIKRFCDRYDFSTNDITEEALKQVNLRHRKGTGAFGFSPQVTRNFQFVPLQLAA